MISIRNSQDLWIKDYGLWFRVHRDYVLAVGSELIL